MLSKARALGRMTNYKALSISDFKNLIVDPETLPYQPKHPKEEIIGSFSAAYDSLNDLNSSQFENIFKYWMRKCQDFKQQYKLSEAEHISKILKEEIGKAKDTIENLESDMFIELEIMEEMLAFY